jgi:hypothetical protein
VHGAELNRGDQENHDDGRYKEQFQYLDAATPSADAPAS